MSDSWTQSGPRLRLIEGSGPIRTSSAAWLSRVVAQYGLSLLFVALATLLAFVVEHLISAPNLTLVYVAPVVIAAVAFGSGPAVFAAVAGVLAFDFFFTQPYYSLRIASPSDIWAAGLLLVTAAVVSSVAAQSRRRALEAEQAAERAQALRRVAQLIIERRPEWEIIRAAADALHTAFHVPAMVGFETANSIKAVATAGGADFTRADGEAAIGALQANIATRAGVYPYGESRYDFWPVARHGEQGWVVGVAFRDRPAAPEGFVDIVRGYIAAAVSTPEALHG